MVTANAAHTANYVDKEALARQTLKNCKTYIAQNEHGLEGYMVVEGPEPVREAVRSALKRLGLQPTMTNPDSSRGGIPGDFETLQPGNSNDAQHTIRLSQTALKALQKIGVIEPVFAGIKAEKASFASRT